MTEIYSKVGTGAYTITYGSAGSPALPADIRVARQSGRVLAELLDSTGEDDLGRRWTTTDLVNGVCVVTGWMKATSGLALQAAVVVQESSLGNSLVVAFGTATGAGGGGPTHTPTLKAMIESFEWHSSKRESLITCMIGFRLAGVQP